MTADRNISEEEQALLDQADSLTAQASGKWELGRYPETQSLYQKALEIWQAILPPDSPEIASGLCNLANLYFAQAFYDKAAHLYRQSVSIGEKICGADDPWLAHPLHWLAESYFANQEYDKAYEPYERVVSIREASLGADSREVADALMDLAHL